MATWLSDPRRRAAVVLVATLLSMAVTARLGVWQLSRAAQKEALQSALDARSSLPELGMTALPADAAAAEGQHYRPVRLQGEWKQGATVFLENRQMNGHPGFFALTPLLLGPNDAVLVQRGWSPRNMQDRTHVPSVPTPSGRVEVLGQIALAPGRLFDFAGTAASGVIRQNLALADFSRELGVSLRPWTVLQVDATPTVADGLLRQWPRPAADVHKHYGYAFQWFALCALLAGLYVWFQLLRPRRQRSA
ncbi:MAG: SURF1 family protein [Cytophagales bacterium]|nr:SURF1 family protein [Rhizobacter sp.]